MPTWGTQSGLQTAYASTSWPWNGAGVESGADLGTLEGSEWDGIVVNSALTPNLLMPSRTPFSGMPDVPAEQGMTPGQRPRSAFPFEAGHTGFSGDLSFPGVAPARWITPTSYPSTPQVKPAIERLAGNLIERATGIPNLIAAIAKTGTAAPF